MADPVQLANFREARDAIRNAHSDLAGLAGPDAGMWLEHDAGYPCVSLSPSCCSSSDCSRDDVPSLRWKIATTGSYFCSLEPGVDYYLNVRLHDPAEQPPTLCNAVACEVSLYQTH